MKKLYFSFFSMLLAFGAMAQVNVTYQVDVTNYIVDYTVGPTGMRIAGNFSDFSAEANGEAMAGWDPVSAGSAMTDMGDNIWSITVTYSADQVGSEQLYKFVNENWGTPGEANEGGDTSLIGTDGCGVDDGAGNINRTLVIPDADITYTFCWEQCLQCDGSDPSVGVEELGSVSDLNVFPNPTSDNSQLTYSLNQTAKVKVVLIDMLGNEVAHVFEGTQSFGTQTLSLGLEAFEAGIYFYQVTVAGETTTGKLVKQ